MTALLVGVVLSTAVAAGFGRLARQAWAWGEAMPARFRGLEDLYRIAAAMTAFVGATAMTLAFVAATHGALDEDGAATTWQLVVIAPVAAVGAGGCASVLTIRSWNRPRSLVPPSLRGDEPRVREEPWHAPGRGVPGVDRSVPDDVDARPWRPGHDPRFAGDRERRHRRDLATAMFAVPLVFAAGGTVLALGPGGDGGVVAPEVAFASFIGVGTAFATYGLLVLAGRLPSVLHGAIPRRPAGLLVLAAGAGAFAVGAVVAGDPVVIVVAGAGSAALCAVAARATRLEAWPVGTGLRTVSVLVLAAVFWSAVSALALA